MHASARPPKRGPASPEALAPDGLERVVRLAARALGVEGACFLPAAEAPPVWAGPLAGEDVDLAGLRGLVMGMLVVAEDTAEVPMLAALVPGAGFFASAPVGAGGQRLGALCLLDASPRPFPAEEQQALAELAALAAELAAPAEAAAPPAEAYDSIFRMMFEQGDQFVSLLDGEGHLLEANPRVFSSGGAPPEEVIGRPLWLCPWFSAVPGSEEVVREAVERAAGGERVRFEAEALGSGGHPVPIALTLTPVQEEQGRVRRLIVEGRDVSEQRRLEAEARAKHAELERIFFASPDAIIFVSTERVVRKASASAARLFGYEPEDLVGRPARDLYAHEEDYKRLGQARFRPEMADETETTRVLWRRHDGSTFLGETTGVPVFEKEKGEPLGYLGIIRDVSEQEAARQALQERETLLRAVVENTPVILYALDAEGTFTLYEGQGTQLAGLEPGQFVGQKLREVYAEQPEVVARNERVLAGETGRWVSRVGDRLFEAHAAPLLGEEGAVEGMIGVGLDVTERIRAEAGLREATRRAQAALREAERAAEFKSAFLTSMSHELRTPLTGVLGFAEILSETLPEEYREPARMIEVGGRQLLETINSVLDFARLEAREVEVREVPVNVPGLVEEAVGLLRPLAHGRGLALEVVAFDPPQRVRTDPALLTRIVNNLVGNAIKFTHEGSVSVEVRTEEEETFVLRVRDTGEGIEPEFLPHLFEAFRQVERPGGEQRGSGLGLAITKRLVELMGGEIEVESAPGLGSTFTVRLPLVPVQPEASLLAPANSR